MVKITAFLPARCMEAVLANLDRVDVTGYTLIESHAPYSSTDEWKNGHAGSREDVFETVAQDEAAESIVEMIREVAKLEEDTDRIVVSPVLDAIRIRTEERGVNAIR